MVKEIQVSQVQKSKLPFIFIKIGAAVQFINLNPIIQEK